MQLTTLHAVESSHYECCTYCIVVVVSCSMNVDR